jgi:hypothetical protein
MLHARVSRLDDYAGELTQALEKLEAERDRGTLNREEQEDFLTDLRKAVFLRDLRPLRNRFLLDLLLAVAAAAGILLVPSRLAYRPEALGGLLGLLALGAGLAVWRSRLYARRYRHDLRWLGGMARTLARGGTIFDPPVEG